MTREEAIEEIWDTFTDEFADEMIKALTQELCEDSISRKAVRDTIFEECSCPKLDIDFAKTLLLQRAIEALPSVTPQEPFINKPCVSEKVCEHDKQMVLDKIRAEIETEYGQCDICEYFENYDYEENDISEYRPIGNIADILQIIDKYKAESENEK